MTSIKQRIILGEQLCGCLIELFSPLVSEIVGQAGYDFAMIDLEHGPGSVMDTVAIMQALSGTATAPLVRVPSNDPVWMKRLLDIGATGIMVPEVNTAHDAALVVDRCYYPPQGFRGVAPTVVRAAQYGANWQQYVSVVNEETLVICQIESKAGLSVVDDIAAVNGVDVLFIGPFDLSAALGYIGEPDHPEVCEAIGRIEVAAKAAGKALGGIVTPGRSASELFDAGYNMVLLDADVTLLRDAARQSVAKVKQPCSGS